MADGGSDFLIAGTKEGVVVAQRKAGAWREMSRSLTSREVTSLSVHGGVILAGTTEGIYRSDDMGRAWEVASEGLTEPYIRWLAHDPHADGVVLAGTEPAAIYLSSDGGEHWRARPEVAGLRDENGWYLPYSPRAGCVRGFAWHGDRAYAAVEQGGLLRSDNGGESWRLVDGSSGKTSPPPEGFVHPDVHSVAAHPLSPDLVFAPTGGGFYSSNDGGATWAYLYRCYCRAVWVDPADASHLILGPADSVDRNGRIEESDDGGRTWTAAAEGLKVPWPDHMVERFALVDHELLAVLSNGDLIATALTTLHWQYILPDAGWVQVVAAMSP
ncbi:MAG: hypothetical protein PVG11_04260 [Anaerolineae bacterium]|jgi:photosystem II stability/assembly factor-like uncharacterized protein